MNLFNELRIQGKLANKRNPMFYKNKSAKVWIYIGIGFWACYLIFFGALFAKAFGEGGQEAYQVLNSGLIFILAIDFLVRFPFQQIPSQEVKPYLLLPVRKKRIIDFLLIRSGLDLFNIFWFFFFVPFAFISMFRFFGFFGIISYLICIWLLFLINNYWFLLCRTLMNVHILWVLLPIVFYGGVAAALFVPKHSVIGDWFITLGDGYIHFNLLFVLVTLLLIAALWAINSKVIKGQIYKEINKVDDLKIKHLSEYKFLDRYGLIGEFSRLELKMLFRNKATKITMRNVLFIVFVFAVVMSFTPVYNDAFGRYFIIAYAFCAVGSILTSRIMSFEGNYIDGLMVRKECILTLLKAKFYLSSLYMLIPFILILPTVIMGKVGLLYVVSMAIFCTGAVYFTLFQLAVYNTQTVPLNTKITNRQSSTSMQKILTSVGMFLPMLLFYVIEKLCGENLGDIILLVIGLGFILTSSIWLRNIYSRFMKRRYQNMEDFRFSRSTI
jgi:hypothetical protein